MTWVAPDVIQQGAGFIYRTTGRRADMLGMGVSVQNMVDHPAQATMYTTVKTLFGGNFLTVRMTLDRTFPDRPQGGDPLAATPTFTSLTPDAAMWAKYVEVLDWAEAEGDMIIVVRNGHTGADGMPYFNGSAGWPSWLVDDRYWDGTLNSTADLPGGPTVAPCPRDRAGYGGHYPGIPYGATPAQATAGGVDADTAFWVPDSGSFSGDLAHEPNVGNGTQVWGGDHDSIFPYVNEMHHQLLEEAQSRRCVAGMGWFMEPDKGALNTVDNFNEGADHHKSVHQMMWSQTMYYDEQRIIEPTRWQAVRGEGGHNWYSTTDFSIYFTNGIGGDPGPCPPDVHLAGEFHDYFSYQDTYVGPDNDVSGPLMNQQNLDDTELHHQINMTGYGAGDSYRIRWHPPDGSANLQTPILDYNTQSKAPSIEAALNALPIKGRNVSNVMTVVPVTVAGPDGTGPWVVTFPNTTEGLDASSNGSFTLFAFVGCSGSITFPDDFSGATDRAKVYTPTPAYVQADIDVIGDALAQWGLPFILGEYSIHNDVIDHCNFFTDTFNANVDGGWLAPMAYFALSIGGQFGIVIGTDPTYTIDPDGCGDVIAALIAQGFPPEVIPPTTVFPSAAERVAANPDTPVSVVFNTTPSLGGLGARILDSTGNEVVARTTSNVFEVQPGSVVVKVQSPATPDSYIVLLDAGIAPETCWAAVLDVG